jgi:hypothetical protein
VYIIGFSLGWGPIPLLVMSELFPAKARGAASGLATLVNWFCAFLVTKETLEYVILRPRKYSSMSSNDFPFVSGRYLVTNITPHKQNAPKIQKVAALFYVWSILLCH